jgi:hypothetical protein
MSSATAATEKKPFSLLVGGENASTLATGSPMLIVVSGIDAKK